MHIEFAKAYVHMACRVDVTCTEYLQFGGVCYIYIIGITLDTPEKHNGMEIERVFMVARNLGNIAQIHQHFQNVRKRQKFTQIYIFQIYILKGAFWI